MDNLLSNRVIHRSYYTANNTRIIFIIRKSQVNTLDVVGTINLDRLNTYYTLALVSFLSLAPNTDYRIIRLSLISKLSLQATQAKTLLYKRSCSTKLVVSLLLATDEVTCPGWKETLLSMLSLIHI